MSTQSPRHSEESALAPKDRDWIAEFDEKYGRFSFPKKFDHTFQVCSHFFGLEKHLSFSSRFSQPIAVLGLADDEESDRQRQILRYAQDDGLIEFASPPSG
jgi:hypothetical protein